jgi:hypothetical protein
MAWPYIRFAILSHEYGERMTELKWNTSCILEEEEQMISFLDGMRIFHTDAILDTEYLPDLYPPVYVGASSPVKYSGVLLVHTTREAYEATSNKWIKTH